MDFYRDFTYVDDVVSANLLATESDLKNGVFNVASGRSVSVMKTIKKISRIIGKNPQWEEAKPPESDPKKTLADISKIKSELGYKPETGFKEGLKNTVDWYIQYKNG